MSNARLSLNQKTTNSWGVEEAVDGCVRHDIPAIGLWREPVADIGVATAARLVRNADLRVSSLCRGGFLTARDPKQRAEALDDNRRALDEAAELGAPCLVLVVGGLPQGSVDLAGARARVLEAVGELAPYAESVGVRLGLEPLHPMYCADRSVLCDLEQALDFAFDFPAHQVGVVVDTFHVWWDPNVFDQIARAGDRIVSFQVCDFVLPIPSDALLARGMMGDGHIDFRPIRQAVDAVGYDGDIEVEIFNADVWATDPDQVLSTMARRYDQLVI